MQIHLIETFCRTSRETIRRISSVAETGQPCPVGSEPPSQLGRLLQNLRDASSTVGFPALAAATANCRICLGAGGDLAAMVWTLSAELARAEAAWAAARPALVALNAGAAA